jgi:putative nucleotidyltransferase with HDIG domain
VTMKLVTANECKEGDILAEDIVNMYGATIVAENTVLNSYIINRLTELGVQQVKIHDEYMETDRRNGSHIYRQIKGNYKESILDIKSIVNKLAAGKPLNAEKIISISNTVCCGLHDSYRILRILNEKKELDEYTYTHSLNVALYAMLIGKWLRLDNDSIKNVIKAGLLHDIGKIKVPIEILNKKARLSDEEFDIIKKHTLYGYDLVRSTDCLSDEVCEAVLLHHEREDKSGYPYGIGGSQLGLYAKIVAVADVYDAMTSDRVYKKRTTPFEAFEMFQTIGVKNFDPKIVKAFLINLSACYVGSKVLLNTGEVGEVAYIPPHSITEPVINIDGNYIDLAKEGGKQILRMV